MTSLGWRERWEELGFGSLWAPEHGVVPADFSVGASGARSGAPSVYADGRINQIMDPLVFLAPAAAATKTVKLGTGICLVPERNPIRLAKEVATLDLVSGGRFVFGIGAGWLQGESEALGEDFPRRWAQTREYVYAMKELWTEPVSEFHGRWVDFPPLICNPKPVQSPHPPLMIGGELSRRGTEGGRLRRRVAAAGADDVGVPRPGQAAEARAQIEELYRANGRDPSGLNITMWGAVGPGAEPAVLRRGGGPHRAC